MLRIGFTGIEFSANYSLSISKKSFFYEQRRIHPNFRAYYYQAIGACGYYEICDRGKQQAQKKSSKGKIGQGYAINLQ